MQASKIGNKLKKYRITYTVDLNPSSQSYLMSVSSSLPITKVAFDGNIRMKTDKEIIFEGIDAKSGITKTIVKV
jgi:hypothetical protein